MGLVRAKSSVVKRLKLQICNNSFMNFYYFFLIRTGPYPGYSGVTKTMLDFLHTVYMKQNVLYMFTWYSVDQALWLGSTDFNL